MATLTGPRPRPRALALFCGLAAGLLCFLFRDAWLHGRVLGQGDFLFGFLPWSAQRPVGWRIGNPLLGDVSMVFYPFALHARTAILHGTFPLWSSAIGAGEPFFASFQSALLSPFAIISYLLPFPGGLTVAMGARLFVGGLGMFLFLRKLPVSTAAAVFGGIAYLLNPFSIVWMEHPLSAVAAWLPWLLLAVEGSVANPSRRSLANTAVVVAFALLSGHPETCFKVFVFIGAYTIYRGFGSGHLVRTMGVVVAGALLGALLSCIQLLPFLEYAHVSRVLAVRAVAEQPLFTNPPASFVTTFVPDFYGTPLGRRFVLAGTNYCEQQVYPGIVTWAFAALSMMHHRHRRLALFFLAAGTLAALIMYGTPAARAAVLLLPPLRVAALSRFGLILITGVAVAGAIGADVLVAENRQPSRAFRFGPPVVVTFAALAIAAAVAWFFYAQHQLLTDTRQWTQATRAGVHAMQLLGAAVILAWAAAWMTRPAAAVLMVALLSADLLAFADGFHPLIPREYQYPKVPEIDMLRADPSVFRVAGWVDTLLPNSAMVYGLQDFRAYDGIGVRAYSELLDVGFHFTGNAHQLVNTATLPLVDLLNVKYVLTPPDVTLPADRFQLVRDGTTRVYRNDRVQPRAFVVDEVVVLSGQAALRAMRDATLDLTRQALTDQAIETALQPERARDAVGTARLLSYRDDKAIVETSADGRRLLVLTDVFYPGWHARVDGVETPIRRTDYAFRGVVVPAGRHVVEFRYEPASFRVGGLMSLAGLALLGWCIAPRARRPATVQFAHATDREATD